MVTENVNANVGTALIGKVKQKVGANAILAVSTTLCKTGATVIKIPFYKYMANLAGNKNLLLHVPAFNVINGGSHAGNKTAMPEFMILPMGASSFKEAMIKKKYGKDATNVSTEGGFAHNFQESKEGLELLKTKAGQKNDRSQKISGVSLKNVYKSFVEDYLIVSIEDPFDQDDWEHYAKLTCETERQVQIVRDDLLVTSPKRVDKAIKENTCNALLLKVNQIGSVTENIEVVRMSTNAGCGVMGNHNSGETEEDTTFIAGLYVGLPTGQIKTGAPCRSRCLFSFLT
ncbi:hypothetical protein IFM89_003943 [Coptis chinensis]|uniref:phosphopyruvate hydratase n=1 Tax=Coptis chinensis TaxID=261450 RepID=A0A835H117_9MAGN|nr:hypothetical protein IFM89_003943 [Coptis chinensis]